MPADSATAADRIRAFVTSEILRDERARIEDDEPLLTSGVIDSFSLVDFRQFLESTFGVEVPESDLTPDTMDTIRMVVARLGTLGAFR